MRAGNAAEKAQLGWERGPMGGVDDGCCRCEGNLHSPSSFDWDPAQCNRMAGNCGSVTIPRYDLRKSFTKTRKFPSP